MVPTRAFVTDVTTMCAVAHSGYRPYFVPIHETEGTHMLKLDRKTQPARARVRAIASLGVLGLTLAVTAAASATHGGRATEHHGPGDNG